MNRLVEQSKALCRDNRRLLADSRILIAISRRKLNRFFGVSGSSDEAAGAPTSWAEALRTLVRGKLILGDLFALLDPKCWGGPATGESCLVCGEKIDGGIEYEVVGPTGPAFAHLVCYSIWHGESRDFARPPTA